MKFTGSLQGGPIQCHVCKTTIEHPNPNQRRARFPSCGKLDCDVKTHALRVDHRNKEAFKRRRKP